EKLLRCHSRIGSLAARRVANAVVTMAARVLQRLSEVGQQRTAAAIAGLGKAHELLQPGLASAPFAFGSCLDEVTVDHGIAAAIKEQAIRTQSIPSGAANFLIVTLNAFGQVRVNDKPDVGLVNPHAESHCRDHQRCLVMDEVLM